CPRGLSQSHGCGRHGGETMKKLIALAAIWIFSIGHALANEDRANVLNMLALISALEGKCPLWRTDRFLLGVVLLRVKIDAADLQPGGQFFKPLVANVAEWSKRTKNFDQHSACKFSESGFGPKGEVFPNLMVPAH